MHRIRQVASIVLVAGAVAGVATAATSSTNLTLVAYSTPRTAYAQLVPAFQSSPAGKDVTFTQSYGASGDQSRAVLNGLDADVVAFSLQPDVQRLVKPGLVASTWNKDAYHGMVTDSVVVLSVRPGNPKHIRGWNDLTKPGVEVITPNPFISGGARWNVMAAYGAQIQAGKSPAQATKYLVNLFKNVAVQDKSARESLQTFASGKGDVLIGYENEAIFARKQNVPLEYMVPTSTILIENPIAAIKTSKSASKAKAFIKWLRTPPAQKIWGNNGYRPVVKSVLKQFRFPKPAKLFTIKKFGGWTEVQKKFFDRQSGIMVKVEREAKGG
jgi:sulfate/thiosulfate transport system substrate-binding protein